MHLASGPMPAVSNPYSSHTHSKLTFSLITNTRRKELQLLLHEQKNK